MRAITELDPLERRIIGVLLEKEQTTPEYYPLTTKAVVSGANQSTNRDPVMNLTEAEVIRVLEQLERERMVARDSGPRADRWSHMLIQSVYAQPGRKALITTLLLRGPQTPGELRGRSLRMYEFGDIGEVEEILRHFREQDLIQELPRRPGQKGTRWSLKTADMDDAEPEIPAPTADEQGELKQRLRELEERVARLENALFVQNSEAE